MALLDKTGAQLIIAKINSLWETLGQKISYVAQTLTDEQKAQARSNIGAVNTYAELPDKPTIPTELSALSDDDTHRTVTDTEKAAWNAKSDFSGSYHDLTDKPVDVEYTDTLSWNANTEGREFYDSKIGYVLYKVSPVVLAQSDFANGASLTLLTGAVNTYSAEDVKAAWTKSVHIGNYVISIHKDDAAKAGASAGTYFLPYTTYLSGVKSLTITDNAVFPKETLIPDILPAALQFGDVPVTLYEGTGLEPTLEDGVYAINPSVTFAFDEGNEYTVILDGAEYKTTAFDFYGVAAIGNPAFVGAGDDNGQPFFSQVSSGTFLFVSQSNFSSLTISGMEAKLINDRYLPGAIVLYNDADNYLYATSDTSDTSKRLTSNKLKAFMLSGRNIYRHYGNTYNAPIRLTFLGYVVWTELSSSGEVGNYYTAEYTAS